MFTGIITAYETVSNIVEKNGNKIFTILKPEQWKLAIGDSVSVNGVCSTIIASNDATFQVEYMPETLRLTTLNIISVDDKINLELSARIGDPLSGHFVYGHIDGTGTIEQIEKDGDSHILTISFNPQFKKYLIQKGSVALNGISLTVINPSGDAFQVAIIPHTWENTNLKALNDGDSVNLEFDAIAKYIEQMTTAK
ncbi:MAG: riboflavin synthase [Candidatus Kerfeldbacteria bacterium]|nr:riboflavin synthase [Bacteroidota bacterium]